VQADRRQWRYSVSVAFASYWLCYAAWVSSLPDPVPIGPVFLGLTCAFLIFFAWVPWRIMARREHARAQDLIVLSLNGATYFGTSYVLLNPQYHVWSGPF